MRGKILHGSSLVSLLQIVSPSQSCLTRYHSVEPIDIWHGHARWQSISLTSTAACAVLWVQTVWLTLRIGRPSSPWIAVSICLASTEYISSKVAAAKSSVWKPSQPHAFHNICSTISQNKNHTVCADGTRGELFQKYFLNVPCCIWFSRSLDNQHKLLSVSVLFGYNAHQRSVVKITYGASCGVIRVFTLSQPPQMFHQEW